MNLNTGLVRRDATGVAFHDKFANLGKSLASVVDPVSTIDSHLSIDDADTGPIGNFDGLTVDMNFQESIPLHGVCDGS